MPGRNAAMKEFANPSAGAEATRIHNFERRGYSHHKSHVAAGPQPSRAGSAMNREHMKGDTNLQISNLRASIKGKVIGRDDPEYDDARRVFFTGFDRRPEAIVRVGDSSDV